MWVKWDLMAFRWEIVGDRGAPGSKSGEIGGVGGLGTSAGTGGRQKDFGAGGGVERWGACVGEVGFDGLSMGDRGRSRRIYLVAVFSEGGVEKCSLVRVRGV